ncbi:MAG TPA: SLBB domain-containing protein [Marinobacter sp.]|uniref:SLBB domain-containing protein n=1 Tax=Marinobacter sp. TaxID=50741 RepID=UPI002D80CA2C|nr:SLBB domain-containing protein [Marinobacter sp.]HET8802327.1 SLBB domain-containing protein [Marinobacter sp.]
MNLKSLLATAAFLLPMAASAQSITSAQIEQFKSLPQAQQEALARQYGVDLDSLQAGSLQNQRPREVDVVRPVTGNGGQSGARGRNGEQDSGQASKESEQTPDGLKPFGYDLFAGAPSTFAPVTVVPVPTNYTIGPGDVLRVQLWGNQNKQMELPVSRNGTIDFPERGPVSVAGQSFQQVRDQLTELVSEQYIGVKAAVSLGELRSMRVFILGEARTPGSYRVSSLSTITNVLYVSGGIKTTGSLRNVQHKRDGKLIGTLDLYDLLLKGDTSDDARLQAGDVIFIPPVGPRAGISGEVYRPALYEIGSQTSLQELVRLAGGLTPQAYPQITRIERTNEDYLRIIAEADLTGTSGKNTRVHSGDRVTVASIADVTGQYIEIKGAATRTGKYAWAPGMRVSSVIRNLDADLLSFADTNYAAIVRTDPETHRISVLNLELKAAVTRPGSPEDLILQEKDQLLFFTNAGKVSFELGGPPANGNQQAMAEQQARERKELEKKARQYSRDALFEPVIKRLKAQAGPYSPQQTVRISGPVRYPGEYPLPATGTLKDAIFVAGGLTDSASLYSAELARRYTDDNGVEQTRIIEVNLTNAMAGTSDIRLQSRDRLLIKSVPSFGTTRTVTLEGEVRYPGEYTFRDGETLDDVIQRAGGLTDNAFPRGAVFTREKLRQLEAQRLREAEERLKGDLLGVQLEGNSFGGQKADQVDQVRGLLEDVQSSRPVGRMVINLPAALADSGYQPIRLRDGDQLTVPAIPQAVSVFGEVQFPTSHLHTAGLTVDDYLERSGGPTRQADEDRIYVVKADGSVMLPEQSAWFGGRNQQLQPGDTVIVPIDVDRLNQLELWTNVSQIVYQMALGAAAVGNL